MEKLRVSRTKRLYHNKDEGINGPQARSPVAQFHWRLLFTASHLRTGVIAEGLQKDLVSKRLVVVEAEYLGQSDLPGRVARELDIGAEEDEEVGLGHDALGQFVVDELHGDVLGREFPLLGHLSQGPGEVDDRLPAILGRDQMQLQVAHVAVHVRRRVAILVG